MDVGERRERVRQGNSSIAQVARDAEFFEAVPFICECGELGCRGLARLSLDAFELMASQPGWYVVGDGHGFRAAVMGAEGVVVDLPALPQASF